MEPKEKRVGTYTFGVMLILIGLSIIIMTFTKLEFARYLLMAWPLVLIGLGIEILYLNSKQNIKVKIDFISIIMVCIVLFCTAVFSIGNYFVNKFLSDKDFKTNVYNNIVKSYSQYRNTD